MAGIFQDRGKAAVLLSGPRTGPAYGRTWVGSCLTAFG